MTYNGLSGGFRLLGDSLSGGLRWRDGFRGGWFCGDYGSHVFTCNSMAWQMVLANFAHFINYTIIVSICSASWYACHEDYYTVKLPVLDLNKINCFAFNTS